MFEQIGDTVAGGWDFLDNIVKGVGETVSTSVSGFFPAPQRQKVVSQIVAQAENPGTTFRATIPEQQSLIETAKWAQRNWLESPYEYQFAVPLTPMISPEPYGDFLGDILQFVRDVGKTGSEIQTVVTEIGQQWGVIPRETVVGTPRKGYPEGRNEIHLNELRDMGANVYNAGRATVKGFLEQVKGLFNLGFDQTGDQPAFAVSHETEPSKGTTIGIGVVVAIAIVLVLLMRKK